MDRHAEVLAAVTQMIAAKANLAPAQVQPETHFINDLNFDSLERVELMMQVEDQFNMTVPDEEAQTLLTVQLLSDAIVEHISRANA